MFKATNKKSGEEIVILDDKWKDQLRRLRSLGKNNILVCPGCLQPVRVRAGKTNRWHFAHKHLKNCPYGYESPVLLNARATLYKWLVGKFGKNVSIEKKFDNERIPRPIDCWVETERSNFVYWIIASGMNPQKRESLKIGLGQLNAQVNWVFVVDMLREDEMHSYSVHLTTTEREFMRESIYDEVKYGKGYIMGSSLHYLDPGSGALTTYRKLHLIHSPQLYQGVKICNELSSVLISPKCGEFVHPDEYENLEQLRDEKIQLERELKETERTLTEAREKLIESFEDSEQVILPTKPSINRGRYEPSVHRAKEATCILCGQITTDYWYHNGKDNTCKCRECASQGRY